MAALCSWQASSSGDNGRQHRGVCDGCAIATSARNRRQDKPSDMGRLLLAAATSTFWWGSRGMSGSSCLPISDVCLCVVRNSPTGNYAARPYYRSFWCCGAACWLRYRLLPPVSVHSTCMATRLSIRLVFAGPLPCRLPGIEKSGIAARVLLHHGR